MSTDRAPRAPFRSRGFIWSAAAVGLIVVLGLVAVVPALLESERNPEPSEVVTAPETPAELSTGGECPESPPTGATSLSAPPLAEWRWQPGVDIPYAVSPAGPRVTDETSIRRCFEQSPEGALLMASNALAMGSDQTVNTVWLDYALSQGDYRDELLSAADSGNGSEPPRIEVLGFRLLSFVDGRARVELALRLVLDGTERFAAATYELVWEAGDWRVDATKPSPITTTQLPNIAGFIRWGVG